MITVSGIDVQVVRKTIKNPHLGVYPPDGHVRVAVSEHVTDDNVRLAVIARLSWIKQQQQDFKDQPKQSEREYISGECHYFLGKRCRLELIERVGKPEVKQLKSDKLKLFVRAGVSADSRDKLLNNWCREEIKNSSQSCFINGNPS
jgi:predicted metal-dependent hydrolase